MANFSSSLILLFLAKSQVIYLQMLLLMLSLACSIDCFSSCHFSLSSLYFLALLLQFSHACMVFLSNSAPSVFFRTGLIISRKVGSKFYSIRGSSLDFLKGESWLGGGKTFTCGGECQKAQRMFLLVLGPVQEDFIVFSLSGQRQLEKLSSKLALLLQSSDSLETSLGLTDSGNSFLGEYSKLRVLIFLRERWSRSSRAGSPGSGVKILPLKYLQLEVSCSSLQFRSISVSRYPLLSVLLESSSSRLTKMCVAKNMSGSSMFFFSKVLLSSDLVHSTVRQLTKKESTKRWRRQLTQASSFCSSFLKGSAARYLKASVLRSFSFWRSSSRQRTMKGALSEEQKQSTQTTRWITCARLNCGAAEITVAQTLKTTSQTPPCSKRDVSSPTSSRSSKLYDAHSPSNTYRVNSLCCELSVPMVDGRTVIRFSQRRPVSLVSPKRRSSFLTQSAMQLEDCRQFLQTRWSLGAPGVLPKTSRRKLPQSEQTGFRQRLHWCSRSIKVNFFWQSLQYLSVPRVISASGLRSEACMGN